MLKQPEEPANFIGYLSLTEQEGRDIKSGSPGMAGYKRLSLLSIISNILQEEELFLKILYSVP